MSSVSGVELGPGFFSWPVPVRPVGNCGMDYSCAAPTRDSFPIPGPSARPAGAAAVGEGGKKAGPISSAVPSTVLQAQCVRFTLL